MIQTDDKTAYAFDTEQEALDFDQEQLKKSRYTWVANGAEGIISGAFNPSASVQKELFNGYYQLKWRFYKDVNFKGPWVQYRIQGKMENTWWGGYRKHIYRNRFAPDFRKQASSFVVDEIVLPVQTSIVTISPLPFGLFKQKYRLANTRSMHLEYWTEPDWKTVYGHVTLWNTDKYTMNDLRKWRIPRTLWFHTWNDNIQSFGTRVGP